MQGGLAALRRKTSVTAELVAFPHTIFALPFAFMGMLLGANGLPTLWQLGWILAAMVGARTAAMAFNRIVDWRLDAANPRTAARPLPSGRMTLGGAAAVLLAAVALFVGACAALSPLCLQLCPLALLIVLGYSYTKRFTWASHLFLGLALAVAPVGAWIAVGGGASWIPALLACAVLLWTAGFDIIYACQDVGFDRGAGLHSIPARFGVARALQLSSLLHALMVAALIGLGLLAGLGAIYFAGVALTAGALMHEHRIVKPDDLSRVNVAFFTMNGWISVTLFVATVLDLFI